MSVTVNANAWANFPCIEIQRLRLSTRITRSGLEAGRGLIDRDRVGRFGRVFFGHAHLPQRFPEPRILAMGLRRPRGQRLRALR